MDYDPYSHRWQQDPYAKYRELRDEAPVHYAESSDAYVVSRHDLVQQVLTSPETFRSKDMRRQRQMRSTLGGVEQLRLLARFVVGMRAAPWTLARSRMLIREDGEVHAVMRNLVNRGFTPRRITAWEGRIRELAGEGLARLRSQGRFDLMSEVAVPLPVTVIAEMLGIGAEHKDDFKRWSDGIIQGGTGSAMDAFGAGEGFVAMKELRRFLRPLVRARRAEPRDDLLSVLVQAKGEAALDDFEIFFFVLLLLVAGNETTTNLLGNAVDALLAHPDQLERVHRDPSLLPQLVEETLRYDGPVQFVTRETRTACRLGDVELPPTAHVVVLLGAANRDERQFPDPDRFDIGRDTRGHVAFGFGKHFCLGASLARLEARTALEVLVPELPRLARTQPQPEFLDSYQIRGLARLELEAA